MLRSFFAQLLIQFTFTDNKHNANYYLFTC